MGGQGQIRAGGAYVELWLKDNRLNKGLAESQKKLTAWGASVTGIGTKVFAAGAALRAPFLAAVHIAAEMGSELVGLRAKTGASIESLSALGYAASVSGSDLESLGNGLTKMQKKIGAAESGSADAADSFNDLGISIEQLKALSPDKQFELIAQKIEAIDDPAKRTSAALDIFGKAGANLLPTMSNLSAKLAEASSAGLIIKTEDAEAAKAFSHALETVFAQVKRVAFGVGSALMPDLETLVDRIGKLLRGTIDWVDANRETISTVAKIGSVVMAAGLALIVLGGALSAMGYAAGTAVAVMSGLGTVIGIAGSALAFLLTPLGLIAAALIGGIAIWQRYTLSGQAATKGVGNAVSKMVEVVKLAFGGILNAISAGDFALAGKIAILSLKVSLLEGVDAIRSAVGGAFGDFLGALAAQLSSGDLTGAWQTTLEGLSALWATFAAGLVTVFMDAMKAVTDKFTEASGIIAKWLEANRGTAKGATTGAAVGGVIGGALGIPLGPAGMIAGAAGGATLGGGIGYGPVGGTSAAEDAKKRAELDAKLDAANRRNDPNYSGRIGGPSSDQAARNAIAAELAASAAKTKAAFDAVAAGARQNAKDAADALRKKTAGAAGAGFDSALGGAQSELAAALARAAAEAGEKAARAKADLGAAGDEVEKRGGKIQGTFSANAASRFGGGGGPILKLVELHKEGNKLNKETRDAVRNQKLGLKVTND